MIVEHLLKGTHNYIMMIPFGGYKNIRIYDARVGTIIQTIDEPQKHVKILAKAVIGVKTDIADALSILLYNRKMESVFKAMRRNWKHDINDEEVLILIVREVDPLIEEVNHEQIEYF